MIINLFLRWPGEKKKGGMKRCSSVAVAVSYALYFETSLTNPPGIIDFARYLCFKYLFYQRDH
jgi:hypothetical protein